MIFGTFKRAIPLVLVSFMVLSGPAHSTGVVNPTSSSSTDSVVTDAVCDPNVFTRMKQKAWMEAQRENYVNQSLILKPDSLFAITCFNKQVGQTAGKLGVNEKNGSASNTDRFKASLQGSAAQISNAFVDKAGGGQLQDTGNKLLLTPNKNEKTGTDSENYDAKPEADSGVFACDEMKKLWQQSQCGNFTAGDLPSLKEAGATGKDARNYPNSCSSDLKSASGTTLVKGVANKDDQTDGNTLYKFDKATEQINKPMADLPNATATDTNPCYTEAFDKLSSYPECKQKSGQNDLCWTGIPVGGTVTACDGKTYPAIYCPNSGCSPQPSGGKLICSHTTSCN